MAAEEKTILVVFLIVCLSAAGALWLLESRERQKTAAETAAERAKLLEEQRLECSEGDYYTYTTRDLRTNRTKKDKQHCRHLKGSKQQAESIARLRQLNAEVKARRNRERVEAAAAIILDYCVPNLNACLLGNQTACRMYCNGPVGYVSCEESYRPEPFC